MRGSPLIRALIAFCFLAALGWPLWHLTHATEIPDAPAAEVEAQAAATSLQVEFTAVPKRFVVTHLEKEVWAENAPQASMDHELSIVYPEKGVDLIFHIEWADDAALSAARVRLTDPAGETHEKSVFGKGTVDEVLTFP